MVIRFCLAAVLGGFLGVAGSVEQLRRLAVSLGRAGMGMRGSPVSAQAALLLQYRRLLGLANISGRRRLSVLQSATPFLQLLRALVRARSAASSPGFWLTASCLLVLPSRALARPAQE